MAPLRWILLLAGLLFLAALALWEKRKPRQAHEDAAKRHPGRNEPELGAFGESLADLPAGATAHMGHALSRSEPARRGDHAGRGDGRRPVPSPPHIDLPTMEAIRDESILAELDALQMIERDRDPGTDALSLSGLHPTPEGAAAREAHAAAVADAAAGVQAAAEARAAFEARLSGGTKCADGNPAPDGESPFGEPQGVASAPPVVGSAVAVNGAALPPEPQAAAAAPRAVDSPPLVEWPPDGERQIVALRIVSASEERLSGRAVRLAITACGFVHGRYGIYHQPDAEGRALLSVASLSKPGVLDPVNMDFQRLSGLSLFTVLPGPLPPAAALDHLIDTARELSQRLPARVQDEQGHLLDAERLEGLRDSLQSLSIQGLSA